MTKKVAKMRVLGPKNGKNCTHLLPKMAIFAHFWDQMGVKNFTFRAQNTHFLIKNVIFNHF